MRTTLRVAAAFALALAIVAVPQAAAAQESVPDAGLAAQVAERDRLIAAQENLLNAYRCMFNTDVEVVPGGCPDPDPISPGAAPPNPIADDVAVRDGLVQAQEALLNVYRCRFGIDTQLVPEGCGEPAEQTASVPVSIAVSRAGGISPDGHIACVLSSSGAVECWMSVRDFNPDTDRYEDSFVDAPHPAGQFTAVSSLFQGRVFCGLRADGTIRCWRYYKERFGEDGPDLRTETRIAAWENDAAPGRLSVLSLGGTNDGDGEDNDLTCGIKTDGAAACWHDFKYARPDEDRQPIQYPVPTGRYTSISVGPWRQVCAAKVDGGLTCWQYQDFGHHASSPDFNTDFSPITPEQADCAVTPNGTIDCRALLELFDFWIHGFAQFYREHRSQPLPVDVGYGGFAQTG